VRCSVEALHFRRGQRDLVTGDGAELLRSQRDEAVLDRVGLLSIARRELGRQRRKRLAPLMRFEEALCRAFGFRHEGP